MDNLEKYTDRIINFKPKQVKLDSSVIDVDSIIGSEDELREIREQYPLSTNPNRDDSIMAIVVGKAFLPK